MKYLVSRSISWEKFKKLNDIFCKDDGPTPVGVDRILWEMLRDGKIKVMIDTDNKEDGVFVSLS